MAHNVDGNYSATVYRNFQANYLGLRKKFDFSKGQLLSTVISMLKDYIKGNISGIVTSVIAFTASNVVKYAQSVRLDYYSHFYDHKIYMLEQVRIGGSTNYL